jgi:hypothetical protein
MVDQEMQTMRGKIFQLFRSCRQTFQCEGGGGLNALWWKKEKREKVMTRWDIGGIIKGINPAYEMIASKPDSNQPGMMGIEMVLPVTPPLTVRLYFDRNNAEEFINHFRDALDLVKGITR